MDAFLSEISRRLRQQIYLLVSRWPTSTEGAMEQARDVFEQLKERDPKDLAQHIEAYLLLAASGLLRDYDRHRTSPSDQLSTVAPLQAVDPAECQAAIGQMRKRLKEDLDPVSRAVLLLHRRDDMALPDIAMRLGISIHTVRHHVARGLQNCSFRKMT